MNVRRLLMCTAAVASAAFADGLDRDSLLAEAPATPARGTVRIAAGGNTSYVGQLGGGISGQAMWSPLTHFAADIGGYWQGRDVKTARASKGILP